MAPHSSALAWKIPWMKEPGRLQSMGSLKVGTWLSDFTFTFHALEKEMATHSSVLSWRIPGTGEPAGLPSVGSHRVGHGWCDLAAAKWLLDVPFPLVLLLTPAPIIPSQSPVPSSYPCLPEPCVILPESSLLSYLHCGPIQLNVWSLPVLLLTISRQWLNGHFSALFSHLSTRPIS